VRTVIHRFVVQIGYGLREVGDAGIGMSHAYGILIGKPEGKRAVRKQLRR
jgi:hypothetical protein